MIRQTVGWLNPGKQGANTSLPTHMNGEVVLQMQQGNLDTNIHFQLILKPELES